MGKSLVSFIELTSHSLIIGIYLNFQFLRDQGWTFLKKSWVNRKSSRCSKFEKFAENQSVNTSDYSLYFNTKAMVSVLSINPLSASVALI